MTVTASEIQRRVTNLMSSVQRHEHETQWVHTIHHLVHYMRIDLLRTNEPLRNVAVT